MAGKDQDLGLSLSLNFHEKTPNSISNTNPIQQLNLMPCFPNKPFWANQLLPSSDRRPEIETRSFFNGIDVNSLPCATEEDEEEDAALSSPNSGISSISGKRSERENYNGVDENDIERSCSRGISDEEDAENARKKLRLSKDQSAVLEESFKEHNTLNPKQKQALAKKLGLRPRQVEVWFQNRRARTKLKQTEVDCEYLKRCCENLTDENRRLQKEVQELRALKLSPQLYMQMTPPTTLTICPSCERVGAPSSADPRPHPVVGSGHQRQVPMFNPWGAPAISQRPFNALRS